jgi:hypothetical protein
MTLVEFLHPIKSNSNRDKCLAVLYYKLRYENIESMTAQQIHQAFVQTRMPNAAGVNVPDVLAKSGALVDSPGSTGSARLWRITDAGRTRVRHLMGLPETEAEVEHDISELNRLLARITDPIVKGFVEESVSCIRVGALKAAIVFLWAGAVRTLQEKVILKGVSNVNAAIVIHDTNARQVKKVDDFQYIKDKTFLLAAEGVGILDKAERGTLESALDLRNKCGHPTKYSPGPARTKSFIEDVTGIVFP